MIKDSILSAMQVHVIFQLKLVWAVVITGKITHTHTHTVPYFLEEKHPSNKFLARM